MSLISWRLVLTFDHGSEFSSPQFDLETCPCLHCWCGKCGSNKSPAAVFQRLLSGVEPNVSFGSSLSEDKSIVEIGSSSEDFNTTEKTNSQTVEDESSPVVTDFDTVQSKDLLDSCIQEVTQSEAPETGDRNISVITEDVIADSNSDLHFWVKIENEEQVEDVESQEEDSLMIVDDASARMDDDELVSFFNQDQELVETERPISAFGDEVISFIQQSSSSSQNPSNDNYLHAFIVDVNTGFDLTQDWGGEQLQMSEMQVISFEAQAPVSSANVSCEASTETGGMQSDLNQSKIGEVGSEAEKAQFGSSGESRNELDPISEEVVDEEETLEQSETAPQQRTSSRKRPHDDNNDEAKFMCSVCHRSFKGWAAIDRHLKRRGWCSSYDIFPKFHELPDSHERHYDCNQCSASFSLMADLLEHKQIHSVRKLRERGQNPEAAFTSSDLKALKRVSSSNVTLCDQCPRFFTGPAALSAHKRVHAWQTSSSS